MATERVTTQTEQIRASNRAYIIPLNEPRDGMGTHRYQVYLLRDGALRVLWPSDNHEGKKSKELLNSQVWKSRPADGPDRYPAYHFALRGCGYSKTHEIAMELKQSNPELVVETLTGWMPGSV